MLSVTYNTIMQSVKYNPLMLSVVMVNVVMLSVVAHNVTVSYSVLFSFLGPVSYGRNLRFP
jgi:hypothetical protein